jgi:uncharacterized protein YjbI with pentapeptide repeats
MLKNLYSENRAAITQAELNAVLISHERYAAGRGGVRAQLKCRNLNGLNLANRKLDEADFTGASLVGASLYGSSLVRASLYCADLRRCDLRNAKLMGADIRGASFRGANLSYAVLDNADLRAAMMMYVGSQGVTVVDGASEKTLGGVDFGRCSMRSVSFGNAKLDGVNFSGSILVNANFRGAKLTDVHFEGAVLMGVNLEDLKVPPECLTGCVLDVTQDAVSKAAGLRDKIESHQLWVASGGEEGRTAVLDGADLRPVQDCFKNRSLVGLSACNTIAISIDFSGSQLQAAKFDGADLRGANFAGAALGGASFKKAKLTHARFDKANLDTLHLISGVALPPSLLGAEATEEQFRGAVLDQSLSVLGLSPAANAPGIKP